MIGYHIRKNCFYISATFFVLAWPLVSKAHLIDPNNFNADDLKKITDAVDADKTDVKDYDKKTYNCYHFARDLQYNLWKDHSIESQLVNVKSKKDGKDSEHNAVKVTIRDKNGKPTDVYIEPQDDQIYTDIPNLLQGLDDTKEEKIESIQTSESGVFFPVVTTYVGNRNTHGSLPVKGDPQKFTVKVTVIDAQQRPVAGQSVTITITNADGSKSPPVTGVTDKNGEVKKEVSTPVTGNDIVGGKNVEVGATIHVLPQENEGADSRDPTTTKKLRLLMDRRGACVPAEPDGMDPGRPIYLSEDGQVAMAEFPFFNNTASPIEFQPVFDCRRNCDASDVIEIAFDPATVIIPANDCAIVPAFITNLTAPVGDTIIGQLYGATEESRLVFMNVYDPFSGALCTPSNTMLEFLEISDVAPLPTLLDTSDCTWASDGSSCENPDPTQDICALDTLFVELNTDTIAQILGGQSPADLTVPVSPGHTPSPGRYHLLIAHCKDDILNSPFSHHQYAFPCDSDGITSNNYTSGPPWTRDFFIGTDLWFELLGEPGGWAALVRDPRQGFAEVSSNAFFAIAGREVLVFIPEGELSPSATFRTTAFGHMGSYLFGDWSGRVHPAIGEGPLFPVATETFAVTPPYEASNPHPSNFAMGLPTDGTNLGWIPGLGAVSSDVHFGNTFPPSFVGSTTGNSFDPGSLENSTDYYWQIVEIQSNATSHSSPIWNFSTESPGSGMILREVWEGISGTSVSDLTNDPTYPANPTFSEEISSFETPTDFADNFGSRVHGWLHPVTSGDYTFWIASDDNSELRLSTDENPSNTALIGEVSGWASPHQWDKYPEQKSEPVTLAAGQLYYIEALMKAGVGGDHLSVGWAGPGIGTEPVVIDGAFLSPFDTPGPFPPQMKASNPFPSDGATIADSFAFLEWTAAPGVVSHRLYISDNRDDVEKGEEAAFSDNSPETYFIVGLGDGPFREGLAPDTTYYWRVDGVAADGTIHEGDIWSFTVAPKPAPEQGIIDIFSQDQPEIVAEDEGSGTGAVLRDNRILGGERDSLVLRKTPPENASLGTMSRGNIAAISEGVALVVENGMLILTVGSNSLGQAIVSWDGIDGSATNVQATNGLDDFDITDEGTQHGIALEIASNEKVVNVSIVLFSDPDNSSEMTKTVPVTTDPITMDYLFNDFTQNGNGAILTDIEAVVLFIGSGGSVSGPEVLEIDSIRTYSN